MYLYAKVKLYHRKNLKQTKGLWYLHALFPCTKHTHTKNSIKENEVFIEVFKNHCRRLKYKIS